MSTIEIAAAGFGVIYIILAVKGNAWCWSFGIVSAILYIIFDLQLKYFLDAILQTYYVLAGFYGWYLWMPTSGQENEMRVASCSLKKITPFLLLGCLLTPVLGYVFSKVGNSYPYINAFTAVFSFIATYFTAKKILESWHIWVVVDLILVIQYFLKDAYVTSGFYLFLTAMAVYGYFEWRKNVSREGAKAQS